VSNQAERDSFELTLDAPSTSFWKQYSVFQIFKVVILLVLLINLCIYFAEDLTACLYLDATASLGDYLETFSATIDYVAWMVLIVLFEMETSAQAKNQMSGIRSWVIRGMTAACYAVLVYAAYGYTMALVDYHHYEPIDSETVCSLVEKNFAYVNLQDRPVELTGINCGDFSGKRVYKSPIDHVIVTHTNLIAVQKLNIVNVANATAWLLIVLIFQIEISLKQTGKLTKRWLVFCTTNKIVLYLVLAFDAIYWTFYSAFIDSWDAWLWLVAFLLIDMNLLGWDDSAPSKPDAQIAG